MHVVRPHGLTLEEVGYPADELLAARNKEARNKQDAARAPAVLLTAGPVLVIPVSVPTAAGPLVPGSVLWSRVRSGSSLSSRGPPPSRW